MPADNHSEKIHVYQKYTGSQQLHSHDDFSFDTTPYLIKRSSGSITPSWQNIEKVTWFKGRESAPKSLVQKKENFVVNDTLSIKIPDGCKELESVFTEAKYILDLKDNWDDEGAVGYSNDSWKAGAMFIINFTRWLKGIFSGSLHLPKMHHGPNGSIDIAWNENNYRLFVNIDVTTNKGSFYSDAPNKQYSEGEFFLDDFKFHMLPLPFKY